MSIYSTLLIAFQKKDVFLFIQNSLLESLFYQVKKLHVIINNGRIEDERFERYERPPE